MTGSSPSLAPSGLRIERITDAAALAPHATAWDALGAASPAPVPLLTATYAWTASHLEHRLAPRERWTCYLAYDGEHLVGVFPVVRRPHALFRSWRSCLRVPGDFHTRDGDVALAEGREAEALRALLRGVREGEGTWLELTLGGIRAGSPTVASLPAATHGTVVFAPDLGGRLLSVEGDGDAWLAGLAPNFRRNLRKARNRCESAGARVRVLREADADPDLFARFAEIEGAGWKGREGTSIASRPSTRAFYEAFARRAAARGWLEWHLLELDGRWIAAHLAVRLGTNLVLLRIAFDEDEKRLSPGNVLFAHVLQTAFERDDVTVVDCLTDQPWHDNWQLEHGPYRLARVFPRAPLPFLFGAVPAMLRPLARRLLRRG